MLICYVTNRYIHVGFCTGIDTAVLAQNLLS